MKNIVNKLIPLGCLFAVCAASGAQTPPAAPAAPVPPAAAAPAPAPAPKALRGDFGTIFSSDWSDARMDELAARAEEMALRAREMDFNGALFAAQDMAPAAQRRADEMAAKALTLRGRAASADAAYQRGQSALDRRRWDEALDSFTQAIERGGSRTDGALYWKAYALNKLGRRDEAMAALAELRKTYASSRWLDDAKALELEVKQASGRPVSPDSENDENLKLMALNGLMQSDPERALPTLEGLLKSAQSPRLKERALFVLAQSSLPKAQQTLEQVARGSANPDLQVKAIEYLAAMRRRGSENQPQAANGQIFAEVFASTADVNVKRAALNALMINRDSARMLQLVKAEKNPEVRAEAVRRLASIRSTDAGDTLAGLYAGEQDKDVKRAIIESLYAQKNVKALVSSARAEKDPEMVQFIVSRIANMKSPEAADYLTEILKK